MVHYVFGVIFYPIENNFNGRGIHHGTKFKFILRHYKMIEEEDTINIPLHGYTFENAIY